MRKYMPWGGALLLLAAAAGQTPMREATPNDTLKSPEVSADHHVTFRIFAPKASEVTLTGD
jgi:enterochelin esterase family protein